MTHDEAGSAGGAAYAWSGALVAAGAVVALLGRAAFHLADVVMLFLLAIMVASHRFGRGPAVFAAALSVATYDFFFIPPYYTFSVEHIRHTLTFAMMFGLGLVMSDLTSSLRRHERAAREREARTATLYALSRELVGVPDASGVARVSAQQVAAAFGCAAAVLLREEDGSLVAPQPEVIREPLGPEDLGIARWASDSRRPAGAGTEILPAAKVACIPLVAGEATLGVLVLVRPALGAPDRARREFLEVLARQTALAIERVRLSEEARVATLRARTEQLRSSLLSAVSHDLRTPLATITGAATTLRDERARLAPEQCAELVETICDEAERMERLIGNILAMVRIESGGMELRRDWVPLEEVLGSALLRLEARLAGRTVQSDLPEGLPLVPLDPVLFEQVFVNLLENAAKYTPDGTPVSVSARGADGAVEIEIADRGPGIPAGMEERIFEKFQRGPQQGVGAGLGLSICRGIVEAHGGSIAAANREGGGAVFRIRLPLRGPSPATRPEGSGEGAS